MVGDVSSDHLRLKGFYKDNVRTAIDRKKKAIADYLIEYCNPGGAYFVLELISPIHHYSGKNYDQHLKSRHRHKRYTHKNNFKKRRVHRTKFTKKRSSCYSKNMIIGMGS